MNGPIAPEMLIGKDVYDAKGGLVGDVVDVGVLGWGRVKFLLVDVHEDVERYRRLSVDLIEAVGEGGVFLKPSEA